MRYDPKDPKNPDNDRFVLSKGHAAPILYAAWAEAGLFPREELLKLRPIGSDLEGHPTPRLSFVDVATGSLGQGICAAIGTALNARRIGSDYRTYVLLGDGEMAEGSVWEAANIALYYKLDNLCGVVDVNGLGQSQATQFGHDMDAIAARWTAFGWHTHRRRRPRHPGAAEGVRRGARHDGAPDDGARADAEGQRARRDRGQGRLARQGAQEGRRSGQGDRRAREADGRRRRREARRSRCRSRRAGRTCRPTTRRFPPPPTSWATWSRRARRGAPRSRPSAPSTRASSRSTPTSRTRPSATGSRRPTAIASSRTSSPSRSWSARRWVWRRAARFRSRRRSPAFSPARPISSAWPASRSSNVKFTGSHAGVSIGEDGPSQMALEDLSMMRAVPGLRRPLSVRRRQHRAAGRRDGPAHRHGLHADVAAEDAGHLRTRRDVSDRRVEGAASERQRRRRGRRRRRHGVRGAEGLRSAESGGHRHPRHRRVFRPADRRQDDDRGRQRPPAARSSRSRITTRPAASAMRSARRWRRRDSWCAGSRSARFRAAVSRTSCVDRYGISARHIVGGRRASVRQKSGSRPACSRTQSV